MARMLVGNYDVRCLAPGEKGKNETIFWFLLFAECLSCGSLDVFFNSKPTLKWMADKF
jgi:hypothetical protein